MIGCSLASIVARNLYEVLLKLKSAFAAGDVSNARCTLHNQAGNLWCRGWGRDVQALSYYKIFGYPTGLGALVVHNSVLPLLNRKRYFGGGTVAVSVANDDFFEWALLPDCFPTIYTFLDLADFVCVVSRVAGYGYLAVCSPETGSSKT